MLWLINFWLLRKVQYAVLNLATKMKTKSFSVNKNNVVVLKT